MCVLGFILSSNLIGNESAYYIQYYIKKRGTLKITHCQLNDNSSNKISFTNVQLP